MLDKHIFFIKLDFHRRFTIGPSSSFMTFTKLIIANNNRIKQKIKDLIDSTSKKSPTNLNEELNLSVSLESKNINLLRPRKINPPLLNNSNPAFSLEAKEVM
jgi:hypothetical protein